MTEQTKTIAKTIAMWSGPRNLSTAMMRAFENRPDCTVWDEPFYAAYLAATGLDHPMRDETLAAGITDAVQTSIACQTPTSTGIYYQKHMTHHMLSSFPRDWLHTVENVFLIRDPARVAASYEKKFKLARIEDIGFIQQRELFDCVADRLGHAPTVIDATDIRQNPSAMIKALCEKINISFDPAMLSWPKGLRASDGAWAPHWYHAVIESTGFAPPETDPPKLSANAQRLSDAAMPYYTALKQHALTV